MAALSELAGVKNVDVDLLADEFTVSYDADVVMIEWMNEAIVETGFKPSLTRSRINPGATPSNSSIPEPVLSALRTAQENGKLIFIDFYAEWCGACKSLERTTLADAEVRAALGRFVFLKIDTDQHTAAAKHFKVVGLPTVVALSASGEERYRHVGPIDAASLTPILLSLP
jgi:thiol:disulfide interchange protein